MLRTVAVLAKRDLSLASSTHTKHLATTCNFSSGDQMPFSRHIHAEVCIIMYDTHAHISLKIKYSNFQKENGWKSARVENLNFSKSPGSARNSQWLISLTNDFRSLNLDRVLLSSKANTEDLEATKGELSLTASSFSKISDTRGSHKITLRGHLSGLAEKS